jgi:hypothetical protein
MKENERAQKAPLRLLFGEGFDEREDCADVAPAECLLFVARVRIQVGDEWLKVCDVIDKDARHAFEFFQAVVEVHGRLG